MGQPRRPHVGPECSKPLAVDVSDLPAGAQAAILVTGPGGFRHPLSASGSLCLTSEGDYSLVAEPVTFTNPLGRPWDAYPTTPTGALPDESVGIAVSQALIPDPTSVSVSYFDQAPLTTIVVPPSLVVLPSGRLLPRFGGFQVRKTTLTSQIKPGDIVVSPAGPGLPHGLLGTVTEAHPLTSGISLQTVAASPFRAFSQGRLVASAVSAAPVVKDLGALMDEPAQHGRLVPAQTTFGFGCGQSFTVGGSVSFKPSMSAGLGWSWGPWYAPWQVEVTGDFWINPDVSATATVSSSAGINCQFSTNFEVAQFSVPVGEFGDLTFIVNVTVSVGGSVGEQFSQSATESLTSTVPNSGVGANFSFGYNGNNFSGFNNLGLTGSSNVNDNCGADGTSLCTWQGSVAVGLGPTLEVQYGIPDVAGIGPEVGVQDKLTLNAGPNEGPNASNGWDVQAGADASVGIAASALGFSYSDFASVGLGSPITLAQGPWPQQPSPPLDVQASPGATNTELDVSWQPPIWGGCGLSGYTVSAGPQSTTVSASATSATLSGLSAGTAYTVTVQAGTGCSSTSEATASATTAPLAPPPAPALNSVTTARGWGRPAGIVVFQAGSCPSGTSCSPVTGYVVNWSGDGTTGSAPVASSSALFYVPAYGVPYSVTVNATSSAGPSASSSAGTFTPQEVPTAPLDVSVTAGPGPNGPEATVTWSPPASDGGLPLTSYQVAWLDGTVTQPVSAGTTTVINLPAYGVSYGFIVTATNSLGSGDQSPLLHATALTVPTAPTGVSASVGAGTTVNVSWGPPGSDGGTPATSYQVDWAGQGTWGEDVEAGSATSAAVQVPAQGAYEVTVFATNQVGEGAPSAPVCVTVGASAPCAPTITSASAARGKATVSWSPAPDSGSSPVTSYTVAWAGPTASSSGSLVQQASAGTTATFDVSALGRYSVTMSATNSVGTGPASPAATFSQTVPPPPPPKGCGGKGTGCPKG